MVVFGFHDFGQSALIFVGGLIQQQFCQHAFVWQLHDQIPFQNVAICQRIDGIYWPEFFKFFNACLCLIWCWT